MWQETDVLALMPQTEPSPLLLYVYALTGPTSTIIPGLSLFKLADTVEHFGWDKRFGVEQAMQVTHRALLELTPKLARYDEQTRVLWIPSAIRRNCNRPASTNVVRSWKSTWAWLPDCDIKRQAAQELYNALFLIGQNGIFARCFAMAVVGDPKLAQNHLPLFPSSSFPEIRRP